MRIGELLRSARRGSSVDSKRGGKKKTAPTESQAIALKYVPNDVYNSRLQRARDANLNRPGVSAKALKLLGATEIAEAADDTREVQAESDDEDIPSGGRVTELRTRLRILMGRNEVTWSAKEMRATLKAGGIHAEAITDRSELREMVTTMADVARARWAQEAALEAAAVRAAVAARAGASSWSPTKWSKSFRARSRAMLAARQPAATEEGETYRGEAESDDEDSIEIVDSTTLSGDETPSVSHRSPKSYRRNFRARGSNTSIASSAGAEESSSPRKRGPPQRRKNLADTPRSERDSGRRRKTREHMGSEAGSPEPDASAEEAAVFRRQKTWLPPSVAAADKENSDSEEEREPELVDKIRDLIVPGLEALGEALSAPWRGARPDPAQIRQIT